MTERPGDCRLAGFCRVCMATMIVGLGILVIAFEAGGSACAAGLAVRILADATITSTTLPGNGSTPLWAYGAPMLVREGDTVWASISVTDPGEPPYCNTHWELWRKQADQPWERVRAGAPASEREPCPVAMLDADTLVLAANPKVMQRNDDGGAEVPWFCQPVLPSFNVRDPRDGDDVRMLAPVFPPGATFRQHSYRGLAADPARQELLLLMIEGDDYLPTWRTADGRWSPLPTLRFPIRACYPQVVLRERAAHVLAIGDIVETNEAWKAEKHRVLQKNWDYVFRRLFHAWTPDVAAGFQRPVEIDSVDETAGAIRNLDLLLDRAGRAHVLYSRRNIDFDFIRDRFFSGEPITDSLEHVVFADGRVVRRETLLTTTTRPGAPAGPRYPFFARLHELADGRMLALVTSQTAAGGVAPGGLLVRQIEPAGSPAPVTAAIALGGRAFAGQTFFTNTPRGGSAPGGAIDLLAGESDNGRMTLRHVSLAIE